MGDNKNPSKLKSWLYWKKLYNNWVILEQLTGSKYPSKELFIHKWFEKNKRVLFTGICPICDGWEEIPKENVYCICKTLHWSNEKNIEFSDYQNTTVNKDLGELGLYGDPQDKQKQKLFIAAVNDWLKDPSVWLTVSGPLGVGKTHALKIIANHYYPIALYISAIQFESNIFKTIKEGTLEDYVMTVARAPVLLFDDWGADYGSQLTQAKLRMVIDWRYQNPKEYPTIVTTNKSVKMLMSDAYNLTDRIASRIMDAGIANVIDLSGVSDYRLRR